MISLIETELGTPGDEPEHATDEERQQVEGALEAVLRSEDEVSDEEEDGRADDARHERRHNPAQEDGNLSKTQSTSGSWKPVKDGNLMNGRWDLVGTREGNQMVKMRNCEREPVVIVARTD